MKRIDSILDLPEYMQEVMAAIEFDDEDCRYAIPKLCGKTIFEAMHEGLEAEVQDILLFLAEGFGADKQIDLIFEHRKPHHKGRLPGIRPDVSAMKQLPPYLKEALLAIGFNDEKCDTNVQELHGMSVFFAYESKLDGDIQEWLLRTIGDDPSKKHIVDLLHENYQPRKFYDNRFSNRPEMT